MVAELIHGILRQLHVEKTPHLVVISKGDKTGAFSCGGDHEELTNAIANSLAADDTGIFLSILRTGLAKYEAQRQTDKEVFEQAKSKGYVS